jgi:hypothetical protein
MHSLLTPCRARTLCRCSLSRVALAAVAAAAGNLDTRITRLPARCTRALKIFYSLLLHTRVHACMHLLARALQNFHSLWVWRVSRLLVVSRSFGIDIIVIVIVVIVLNIITVNIVGVNTRVTNRIVVFTVDTIIITCNTLDVEHRTPLCARRQHTREAPHGLVEERLRLCACVQSQANHTRSQRTHTD